jgi:predicted Rossmann fold nucleotide-binding protein DprA/Smf involved in DNA uptake
VWFPSELLTAAIRVRDHRDHPSGDVDREPSVGTNLLIRDGAHPVLDPNDLIEELALLLGPPDAAGAGGTIG